ncbi:MAG: hypothetical protein ACQKBU_00095 [Verrucomicrobiales bacterium]
MIVALVHHHLRPGGVTSVIRNAEVSLQRFTGIAPVVVAGSGPSTDDEGGAFIQASGLDYREDEGEGLELELADALAAAVPEAEVWHVHNPTLGKNLHLPGALGALHRRGASLLLQIHDFAEEGRPSNLRIAGAAEVLYPAAHYALVNRRDMQILTAAGLPEDCCHYLPNPVAVGSIPTGLPRNRQSLLFYPVRGIPRKNLGEAVMFAAVADSIVVASSAAPDNLRWRGEFEAWRALIDELDLPAALGVVGRLSPRDLGVNDSQETSFEVWNACADRMLTTSVAEGFGMVFLESYAKGKALMGRDLPEITTDFRASGLRFPGLYEGLMIPGEWVNEVNESEVDFSQVNPAVQREIVRRVWRDPKAAEKVRVRRQGGGMTLQDWIRDQLATSPTELMRNREIITEQYSLRAYAERLKVIYQTVVSHPVAKPSICAEKVRCAFGAEVARVDSPHFFGSASTD